LGAALTVTLKRLVLGAKCAKRLGVCHALAYIANTYTSQTKTKSWIHSMNSCPCDTCTLRRQLDEIEILLEIIAKTPESKVKIIKD